MTRDNRHRYHRIKPQVLSPILGATIPHVNLVADLNDEIRDEIQQAFLEYQVLVFPGQQIGPADLMHIGQKFGELERYPLVAGLPDYPEVIEVIKKEQETVNFGGIWHSDTTYMERPPKATLLYARLIPPIGGDTLFASTYTAYESLSEGMQSRLAGLKVINSSSRAAGADTRVHRIADNPSTQSQQVFESRHPVVRTHPETGRCALYCNNAHSVRFEGMTEAESQPILQYLYAQQQKPEFGWRHRWQTGDLILWDNRCTQHNALNDYQGYRREMMRVTLKGDVPA